MHFSRGLRCALGALTVLCLAGSAGASLNFGSGLGTTHAGNLVSNGSFELGNITPAPADGVHAPLLSTMPDDWTAFGAPMGAVWGNDGITPYRLKASDVLADQRLGVFFGTGTGTGVAPPPNFQPNGRVTFGPGGPTFIYAPNNGPVSIKQSVPNLSASQTYKMSFWVSGEENSTNQGNVQPGILEFNLTNVLAGDPSVYLAVPNGTLYGMSKLYEFTFQPLANGPVDITFTGHGRMFYAPTQFGPAAILDDVIINVVPEPATALSLLGVGAIALTRRSRRV